MNRLVDKVAVITGAGSGIGRAAARMFVAEGAKVVVAEIDATLGEAAAREAGADARFVRTDVTDEESVREMVQQAKGAFGRIDVLLNCAGGSLREDRPVAEVDLSVWDHTIDLDLIRKSREHYGSIRDTRWEDFGLSPDESGYYSATTGWRA